MRNWWKDGIPFSCTQCGKCCHIRNDMAFVFLNKSERKRLAITKNMSLEKFERTYCLQNKNQDWILKFKSGRCVFLKGKKCSVNTAKPTQCRTWPFWPELLVDKKTFKKEVIDFCPGSRKKTPIVSAKEIKKQIKEIEDAFFEV